MEIKTKEDALKVLGVLKEEITQIENWLKSQPDVKEKTFTEQLTEFFHNGVKFHPTFTDFSLKNNDGTVTYINFVYATKKLTIDDSFKKLFTNFNETELRDFLNKTLNVFK
jgi:hypothetical protein